MKSKKHILIVDDVTTNLKCLGEILKNQYSLSMAKSGEQALSMIKKNKPDLVLLDVKMPMMDGYETFNKIKENPDNEDIPIIFLTADTDCSNEVKGLKLGANDYIRKPYEPDLMIERIERVLHQIDVNKEMKEASLRDSLTGLWNRKYMQEKFEELSPEKETGSFIILDLDNFKGINDTYGHVIGDAALISFAKTLVGFVHKDDIVARIGGDEFVIFLKNCYGKELLSERISGLIPQVEKELRVVKEDDSVSSVSIGISAYPFDGSTFSELYNNADKALYYVKRNGKSGFHFYDASDKYLFTDSDNQNVVDVTHLKAIIEEHDSLDGPFKVEYNNFKSIYRFLKRLSDRTGENIQIALFTLKDLSYAEKGEKSELSAALETLEKCIKDSLRKNDVSTQYSFSQFLIILMDCDDENREMVIDRIIKNWNERNETSSVILKYDIEEISSISLEEEE